MLPRKGVREKKKERPHTEGQIPWSDDCSLWGIPRILCAKEASWASSPTSLWLPVLRSHPPKWMFPFFLLQFSHARICFASGNCCAVPLSTQAPFGGSWHTSHFNHIITELQWKLSIGNTLLLMLSAATSLYHNIILWLISLHFYRAATNLTSAPREGPWLLPNFSLPFSVLFPLTSAFQPWLGALASFLLAVPFGQTHHGYHDCTVSPCQSFSCCSCF